MRDEEAARSWMNMPIKALSYETPLNYIDTETGIREVEQVLGRIEHGVFS